MLRPLGPLLLLLLAACTAVPQDPRPIFSLHTGTTGAPISFLRQQCVLPRGRFPHPYDCSKYIDCWDGRALEKICPDGQLYSDLEGGFCDNREYVDCGDRPMPEPPTQSPIETPPPPPAVKPPEDFEQIGDGWYKLFTSRSLNWAEARLTCLAQDAGSDLLVLDSQQEENALVQVLRNGRQVTTTYIWLGVTDLRFDTQFEDVTTRQLANYLNWGPNEPNNHHPQGSRSPNCVTVKFNPLIMRPEWFVQDCETNLPFVCKWTPPRVPQVPQEFIQLANGNFYMPSSLSTARRNWWDARHACVAEARGSDIVVLETPEENQMVVNYTLKLVGPDVGFPDSFWVGLSDIRVEGDFAWEPTKKSTSHTDWDMTYREPNGGNTENCVFYARTRDSLKWADITCFYDMRYICELPGSSVTTHRKNFKFAENLLSSPAGTFHPRSSTFGHTPARGESQKNGVRIAYRRRIQNGDY